MFILYFFEFKVFGIHSNSNKLKGKSLRWMNHSKWRIESDKPPKFTSRMSHYFSVWVIIFPSRKLKSESGFEITTKACRSRFLSWFRTLIWMIRRSLAQTLDIGLARNIGQKLGNFPRGENPSDSKYLISISGLRFGRSLLFNNVRSH